MPSILAVGGAAALAAAALLYNPVHDRLSTFGMFRKHIINDHGVEALKIIPNTEMCEDLHIEHTTQQLFAACQLSPKERSSWFPPLEVIADHKATGGGAIVRIDPVNFKATTLSLKGFSSLIVTHGIDILNDPKDSSIIWIYAVNHLPNPARWDVHPPKKDLPIELATIEIFKHQLGTDEAEHVRSIQHDLIRLPNDIVAVTPTSFYVTNDHVNFQGPKRAFEDFSSQGLSPTPDTILVDFTVFPSHLPTFGVTATRVLHAIHNNNGLGHGPTPDEIGVVDASGGVLHRVFIDPTTRHLSVHESIHVLSTLDNPHYYHDPYATATNNATGWILPGLARAHTMMADFVHLEKPIPSIVWHVKPDAKVKGGWEKKIVFLDDGRALRSASGSVLIGIDPKKNGGKKQGWLFATGFGSLNVVAAKIDL